MEKLIKIRITDTLNNNECTADVKYDESYSVGKLAYEMVETVETACCYFINSDINYMNLLGIKSPYDKYHYGSDDPELSERYKKFFTKWIHAFGDCLDNLKIEPVGERPANFPETNDVIHLAWEISHDSDDEEWYKDYDAKNEKFLEYGFDATPIKIKFENKKTGKKVVTNYDNYHKCDGKQEIICDLGYLFSDFAYPLIDNDLNRIEELDFKIVDEDLDKVSGNIPSMLDYKLHKGFYSQRYSLSKKAGIENKKKLEGLSFQDMVRKSVENQLANGEIDKEAADKILADIKEVF